MRTEQAARQAFKRRAAGIIASVASWMELAVAVVVLVALVASCFPVVGEMLELFHTGSAEGFHTFLSSALYLVIGVEFIEMLTLHKPGNALEVMLFAIVRHMLVGDGSSVDILLSVLAVGVLFVIRKFAFISAFAEEDEDPPET